MCDILWHGEAFDYILSMERGFWIGYLHIYVITKAAQREEIVEKTELRGKGDGSLDQLDSNNNYRMTMVILNPIMQHTSSKMSEELCGVFQH